MKNKIWQFRIKSIKFSIKTKHKYLKYENMFKKFFEDKKQKILQNSKYWMENYYNYLKSFVMYTDWLFNDLENENFRNIRSYVVYFRKLVKKLKEVK